MIRRNKAGRPYCDGRECGFPLSWHPPDPVENEPGLWVCLDCNASMYGEAEVSDGPR